MENTTAIGEKLQLHFHHILLLFFLISPRLLADGQDALSVPREIIGQETRESSALPAQWSQQPDLTVLAETADLIVLTEPTVPGEQTKPNDPRFSSDKYYHFAASFLITGGSYLALSDGFATDAPDELALAWSAGISISVGLGKELYDWVDYGLFSWRDIVWDLAGTAAGLVAMDLIHRRVEGP